MVMVHTKENTVTVELIIPKEHYEYLEEIINDDDWTREIRGERANDDEVARFIDEKVIPQYIVLKRRNREGL